jgi:hypothetical protein
MLLAIGLLTALAARASPVPLVLGTWDFHGYVTFDPQEIGTPLDVPYIGVIEFLHDLTFRTLALDVGDAWPCASVSLPGGPGYRIQGLRSVVGDALTAGLGDTGRIRKIRGALDLLPDGELDGAFSARIRMVVGEQRVRGSLTGYVDGTKRPE